MCWFTYDLSMNPILPSRFPKYRIREFLQKWVVPSVPWLGAAFFSFMLLQPHKFAVAQKESKAELLAVQEAVDELVQTAKKVGNDGQIQFDMLITLEGDDSIISYSVAPGDTLSEIAKLFGTTSSAIGEANAIGVDAVLRVGQKLKIAYDNSIIYDIEKETSIEAFAKEYNISLEELITLNSVDDITATMETGQQIFVPLNRVEAQDRGLIKKKEFVMLDLPRKTIEDG